MIHSEISNEPRVGMLLQPLFMFPTLARPLAAFSRWAGNSSASCDAALEPTVVQPTISDENSTYFLLKEA